jgi:hypothetical protein
MTDLAHDIAYLLGYFLGVLFMVVWIPLAWYNSAKFVKEVIKSSLPTKQSFLAVPEIETKTKPKTAKKPHSPRKTKYKVVATYEDEHKINNDFEFKD